MTIDSSAANRESLSKKTLVDELIKTIDIDLFAYGLPNKANI